MGIIDKLRAYHHQTKYIRLSPRECIACWECVKSCPKGVLGKIDFLGHRHVKISDSKNCVGCMKCVRICPKNCFKTKND
ncbi:MAG: 4Fe-4S binding protein [Muribaculaceae bacterium]|nr:4Fe-4S binding protein [Muribaculaceae bacterium]MDE6462266.1 4Fe-4S binding protein [Muribaculaceae bacterium]